MIPASNGSPVRRSDLLPWVLADRDAYADEALAGDPECDEPVDDDLVDDDDPAELARMAADRAENGPKHRYKPVTCGAEGTNEFRVFCCKLQLGCDRSLISGRIAWNMLNAAEQGRKTVQQLRDICSAQPDHQAYKFELAAWLLRELQLFAEDARS